MNKQQIALVVVALAVILSLYFLGPVTDPQKKPVATGNVAEAANANHALHANFDLDKYMAAALSKLNSTQQQYITGLGAAVKRGDVQDQLLHSYHKLASFWRDSVSDPLLYLNFAAKAAELDNSEKSLTFAAHSILGYLPYSQNEAEQNWLANMGKGLFEKALTLNPSNDSTIVGVGGCIIYGASANNESSMQGIMKIREVVQKDSNNLFGQYMLGIGGMVSRQYDKAVVRFEKVAKAQPNNLEVLFKLAETYELMGQKKDAANWYKVIAARVINKEMKAEIEKRIEDLMK